MMWQNLLVREPSHTSTSDTVPGHMFCRRITYGSSGVHGLSEALERSMTILTPSLLDHDCI